MRGKNSFCLSLVFLIIFLAVFFHVHPHIYIIVTSAAYGETHGALETSPLVQRGPIPGIDPHTSYCFYYGKWNDCVIKEVIYKFSLVILHPGDDEPLITKEQVEQLQDANVIVIGYIPFGEDYTGNRPGDGTGPVYYDDQNCRIVYENKGYASWYVDEVDDEGDLGHDGIPDKNPNFQSYYVNGGDPNWQEFIKTATIASDGFAGTEYILTYLGCEGIFIDVLDTAVQWKPYFWTWRGMFDLLDTISNLYPAKYMVVNRPLFACSLDSYPMGCCGNDPDLCKIFCFCDFPSQDAARDRFRQNVNAFVWESYSLDKQYPDFPITKKNVIDCSDNSDGKGFNVLVLDYYNLIEDLYPCMDYQIKETRDLGWLDYIAPGPLDKIGNWVYDYSKDLCSIMIDGHFNEWKPWNVSYCCADPSGDAPRKEADIVDISIAHNAEYLYVKIHCNGCLPPDFSPNFYQIFFSSDAVSSGYKGPNPDSPWAAEFDYLWENGKLHQYTGSGHDWNWMEIDSTSFYALGKEDGTGMEISIPRCAIGAGEMEQGATKLLFNVYAFDVGSNDSAPDDPTHDYFFYEYTPLIIIDGNMEDWENLPGECTDIVGRIIDISGDGSECSADIVNVWMCSDLSNLYFRIQCACTLPNPLWGGNYYQIFIDVDQNRSTGFNACQWSIGAEYLWGNGKLYKHTGGNNCDWSWEWVIDTPYAPGLYDNAQIEISIPRSSIFVPLCRRSLSKEKPLRLIFEANSGGFYDYAPDSPETNYYTWPLLYQKIPLKSGWNLISYQVKVCVYDDVFPVTDPNLFIIDPNEVEFIPQQSLKDWLLDDANSPIRDAADPNKAGAWQRITSFDHKGAHLLDKDLPEFVNTLHYFSLGYGYWIKMNKAGYLIIQGQPATADISLNLKTGWNLMGFIPPDICYAKDPNAQANICPYQSGVYQQEEGITFCPVDPFPQTPLAAISGKYQRITSFDTCDGAMLFDKDLPDFVNTLDYIGPKYGYWIKMLGDGELVFPDGCPE